MARNAYLGGFYFGGAYWQAGSGAPLVTTIVATVTPTSADSGSAIVIPITGQADPGKAQVTPA